MRIGLLIGLAVALLASAAPAETFVVQSGQNVSPYAFTPDKNRGTLNSAYVFTADDNGVDHSFQFYIKWNLPPALLEPGVDVELALAWVYYGYDNPTEFGDFTNEIGELLCHEVLQPWGQFTLKWNNRPAIDNYFDATLEILNKGIYFCDVTELVRQWIADPSTNYGIALTSSRQRAMGFYTMNDATVSPNLKPSLMVRTVPEPAAAASLVTGCLLLMRLERRRMRRRNP
jgi:hypothetical protein